MHEKKIKVLHLITGLNVGGAESMLCKLVSGMNRTSFHNSIVVLKHPGEAAEQIRKENIPICSLKMRNNDHNIKGIKTLYHLLKNEKPHILQTWMYHADFLGLIIGKLARVPNILWNIRCSKMDGSLSKKSTKMVIKACALLSSRPTCIITNSQKARDDHIEMGYKTNNWQIIPNGFDVSYFKPNASAYSSFRKELNLPQDTILIGLIGRFDPAKDHKNFFEAAQILNETHPDVHFILCGEKIEKDNPDIRKLIQKDSLWPNFHLLGLRTDLNKILPALDIKTLSSCREAFPNVLGEAMSCGVICVATDAGECPPVIGDSGFIVPTKNPYRLASAWKKVIHLTYQEKTKLQWKARERIKKNFLLDSVTKKYENLYSKLVS